MGSSASKPQGTADSHMHPLSAGERCQANQGAGIITAQLSAVNLKEISTGGKEIDLSRLSEWEEGVSSSASYRLARTILSKTAFQDALVRPELVPADKHIFNLKIGQPEASVTNQHASGRCWLFATCNLMRLGVIDKYNLNQDFELSQSYLCFADWLEKSNWFLEQMLDMAEEPLRSHTIQYLFQAPQNDGGQFSMVTSLLDKYGCLPQAIFPESYNSSNSSKVDSLLTSKLREYALELRRLYSNNFAAAKEQMLAPSHEACKQMALASCRGRKEAQLAEIYRILSITLGTPPKPDDKFTWEYYSKDGKFHTLTTTPREFYKKSVAPFKADEMVSLINDPRNEYDKSYTVDKLGNVVGGSHQVLYVNTTSEEQKDLVVATLKSGKPVWFGCDVGKCSNSRLGILDTRLHNLEDSFGIKLGMSKADRLLSGESIMTHAMMITAAHLDENGKPVRFRIENSWGPNFGDHGFFMMTSEWFDEYVYQVVVARKFCRSKILNLVDCTEPVLLPADDPMGALA